MSSQECKICNNSKENKQYTVKEMMYGLGEEFIYFECNNCKCLQIQEIPTDMSKYYPNSYYSMVKYDGKKFKGIFGRLKKIKYSNLIQEKGLIGKVVTLFSGTNDFHILKDLNLNKNIKILDVGCGNGRSFLYPLAEVGYGEVKGCDPYLNEPLSYSNGLNISNVSIFDMPGEWDVITYHHSLEHIENQLNELKRVGEILKPDGVCIIRIPIVSSYAWEHYGVNWVQLDAPRHLYLHSTKSIKILAELAGFDLYKTVYDSNTFQFLGSEKYVNENTDRKNNDQEKRSKKDYRKLAKELNQKNRGDQAAFFLKKKVQ